MQGYAKSEEIHRTQVPREYGGENGFFQSICVCVIS